MTIFNIKIRKADTAMVCRDFISSNCKRLAVIIIIFDFQIELLFQNKWGYNRTVFPNYTIKNIEKYDCSDLFKPIIETKDK